MFIYIDNNTSSVKLDNDVTVKFWFDEYCEAKEIYMPDNDLGVSSQTCDSFYVQAGGVFVRLADLIKAAEKHMELCRQEDAQDAQEHSDHARTYGAADYSAR